jgi:SacI restriction endonuclease
MSIDYSAGSLLLSEQFAQVERNYLDGELVPSPNESEEQFDILIASSTQAFREVLLGAALIRILDPAANILLPYANQGEDAYNGRTLDERVVNPFLRNNKIPCSKGPFLSVFRRSVSFEAGTIKGIRDKRAYEAFLELIEKLRLSDTAFAEQLTRYLLYRFLLLRQASDIVLLSMNRISLEQCGVLIDRLLATNSGGRFPVFATVSAFHSLNESLALDWVIDIQGINVADKANGAGGDVTISRNGRCLMAIEITEREVDKDRITATFDTKIAPAGIPDYLFLTKNASHSSAALDQAKRYFAQGHELNLFGLRDWILSVLSLTGQDGRRAFIVHMQRLLNDAQVPASLKTSWNAALSSLSNSS